MISKEKDVSLIITTLEEPWLVPTTELLSCRCSYTCCCCAPIDQDTISCKGEPVHPSSWQGDAPIALCAPCDAFMAEITREPRNGFTAVKLGLPLKGSLKKPGQKTYTPPPCIEDVDLKTEVPLESKWSCYEKRSIKWLDHHGKELTQVREFEPSELEDSGDEQEDMFASCTCAIQ